MIDLLNSIGLKKESEYCAKVMADKRAEGPNDLANLLEVLDKRVPLRPNCATCFLFAVAFGHFRSKISRFFWWHCNTLEILRGEMC